MALPAILARLATLGRVGLGRAGLDQAVSGIADGVDLKVDVKPSDISKIADRERKRILKNRRRALLRTAISGVNIILNRTEDGRGYNGNFKPYSSNYALFRTATGRGSTPNLFYTGAMLGSMTQNVVSDSEARIFFNRASESRKAAFNDRIRPFFGFNNSEKQVLRKRFFEDLMR